MSKKFFPGVVLSLGMSVVAIVLGHFLPLIGSSIFAIAFGILLNQFWAIPSSWRWGLGLVGKKGLQYAIILLGFSLSIGRVSQVGLSSLKISLPTIGIAFLVAYFLGKWLKLEEKVAILIGFGTAICGGSAIAAASPILEAKEEEIALSISTIFFFNILAVFIFPTLDYVFHMSDSMFGTWAGTAINDTSSVVAAAYTVSDKAGDLATIVKLSRALMIVPICLMMTVVKVRQSRNLSKKVSLGQIFPWFILWFVFASALSSIGLVPIAGVKLAKSLSQLLMAMALFAIGSNVSFKQFKKAGLAPLVVGALAWLAVSLSSLLIQNLI